MRKTVLVLLLVFAATAAFANSHMEMKPSPKTRDLDYFVGNWSCKGTAFASPMGPEHATAANVSAKWTAGGYWLAFTYAETKTAQNAMPMWASGFFGYDMEQKKFALGSVDNMGGYATSWSEGWVGDALTFEGPWHMVTMTATGRDMFTKKSATSFVHAGLLEDKGKWMKLDEETCTKMK